MIEINKNVFCLYLTFKAKFLPYGHISRNTLPDNLGRSFSCFPKEKSSRGFDNMRSLLTTESIEHQYRLMVWEIIISDRKLMVNFVRTKKSYF